jgi:lipid-A-disaccharide synthase
LKYEPADLFFAAGEASGDLEGSLLAAAARRESLGLSISALGGERLKAAGARLLYDTTELASIGPLAIIPKLPKLYFLLHGLDREMRKRPPGVFIPVDAGAFNLRLARLLRQGGYANPIVYYFPPGAWLDDPEQARAVASLTLPLTPFAHQRDFYKAQGLRVEYFGHPLVSVISPRAPKTTGARAVIAVLPGSRREEVERHVPVLARTAAKLTRAATVSFYAVAASESRARQIRALWARWGGPEMLISRENAADALPAADVAWIASGTAVLEAALVKVPQITFYMISRAQHRIAARVLPEHLQRRIALPNLVLDRAVVPELLQDDFTPGNLYDETVALLENEELRHRQLADFDNFRAALGPPDALERIATFVVEQVRQAPKV